MNNQVVKKSLFTVAMLSAGVGAGYASMRSSDELFTPTTKTLFSDEAKEVVFIAPDVREYGEILSQLNKNVVIYQLGRVDTLIQMNSYLNRHRDIKAIHIISHGSDGELHLGDTKLELKNLNRYTKELKSLGEKLSKNGDILLYGCNIAKSNKGKEFIKELSLLTSADILASDDITASTKLKGDIDLEFKSGDIEAKSLLTQKIVDRANYKLGANVSFTEQTGEDNPFNGVSVPRAKPTFVDIDNDGDFDAFIGGNDGSIKYYKNTGNNTTATFAEQTGADNPFNGVNVGSLASPVFADIDNDGDFDAFIGEGGGTVKYYKNTGDNTTATFTEQTGASNPFNGEDVGAYSAPALVDIDNDSDFDAFISDGFGQITYYKNDGDNTTPNFVKKGVADSANPFQNVDTGNYGAATFADIDGDGDFDAIIGDLNGKLQYYENTGDNTTPTFTSKTGADNPFDGIDVGSRSAPTLVDIDNDNDLDAFVGESGGTIKYFKSGPSNAAPTASNVVISGTISIGQTLTGSYDYSDTDSDAESGTTFKWYRADNSNGTNASAITDANSTTYTITIADGGKYLTFGVIPNDGTSAGNEVNSSYTSLVTPKVDFNSSIITTNSWNMVSVPDERNVSVSDISGATIWTFNNSTNQWEQPTTLVAGKGYLLYTTSAIGLVDATKTSSTITDDNTTIKSIDNNNTWTLVGISKNTSGFSWKEIYTPDNTLKSGCSYTQVFYYDSVNSTWNTSTKIPYQAGIWVKQNCFDTTN